MRSYALHGLRLAVTGWEEAAAALHGRLERLTTDSSAAPDLHFELAVGPNVDDLRRPDHGRPVYDPPVGEVLYDDTIDRIWIGLGPDRRAVCDPSQGRARLWARQGTGEDLWLLSHPLFTLPLVEMLKRRRLWALHAAGLLWRNRSLVLAGSSGSGKSTLAIALARSGFTFLGDDTLFLAPTTPAPTTPGGGGPEAGAREDGAQLSEPEGRVREHRPERAPASGPGGGLRLLAFPDEVDLTDETATFFPELAPLLTEPPREGWRKRRLRADETWGSPVAEETSPGLLIFPRISGQTESTLAPLDPGEALIELASNVLLTEPVSSQAHLDALANLAAASSCWRLETGRDLDGAVRLLRDLAET